MTEDYNPVTPNITNDPSTRLGFEEYKQTLPKNWKLEHSGVISLRTITENGVIVGYVKETKLTTNSKWERYHKLYDKAYDTFKSMLGVVDHTTFDYWFYDKYSRPFEINSFIPAINNFKKFTSIYNTDEDFKIFVDKIKG
jgi:hypothetical protein